MEFARLPLSMRIFASVMKSIGSLFASLLALLGFSCAHAETPAADIANDPAVLKFIAWQEANALPAAMLSGNGPAPETPGGSRVGGVVWLPEGEAWPKDDKGEPLSFLAQIDFAEVPPLPDYPTTGVLQFFIGRDDLYGANFDEPERGSFKIIYREDLTGAGRLQRGEARGTGNIDDYSPLYDETVKQGLALASTVAQHKPSFGNWLFDRDLGSLLDDHEASDRIFEYMDSELSGDFGTSHVGGHPEFTQSDWRAAEPYQDVDRVLLNLWTIGDHLMWGDMGQGQFMIRREDLLKRDFSKAFYQWDCY